MAQTITDDDLGQDNSNQAGNSGNQAGNSVSTNTPGQASQSTAPSAGQAGQSNSAQSPASGGGSNPNSQKGTGYTNIQKIVSANQGNQLGSAVAGGIQNAGQNVTNNLNTAQNTFNAGTQANQANTSANQNFVNSALQNPTQYTSGSSNPQQVSQFQNLISGQYAGPTSLGNSTQLQSQANNVNQLNQDLSSQGGKTSLLQQFVGNPQYQQGQQQLDSLLLGQQGNQAALSGARKATAGIGNTVNNTIVGDQAQGQQQQAQAQAFGQQVQNQFGQAVSGLNNQLTGQAQQAQASQNAQYQKTLSDLQSGNISQSEANLLGLTNGQQVTGNTLAGIGQYLTQDPTKASAQNVASSGNYATLDALRQLAGQSAPQSAQGILQQYQGNEGQAGTFGSQPVAVGNASGFGNVNNASINQYNNTVNPYADAFRSAQNNVNSVGNGIINGSGGGYSGAIAHAALQAEQQGYQNQLNSARSAYQNAIAGANNAYGGLQNITVNPDGTTNTPSGNS